MSEPNVKTGLSSSEVAQRVSEGKVNRSANPKTKSIQRIFRDNICTLFNLINVILFLALILVGSYRNTLFIGVVLCNTAIGIIQEIRSKRSVDKLTILTDKPARVIRDGEERQIPKEQLVTDDILILSRGDQLPADCVLVSGECMCNESLLTGESDLISKREGDELLSGSFIAAGKCYARVARVGAECYASKLNSAAKYIKKNNSQILKTFRLVIRICTILIFPLGTLMFLSTFFVHHNDFQSTVVQTATAINGTIPGGMILLTSSVLAVSVIRLARKKVLVNEMYCIESLARVDVLCLDKTGTLTAEQMDVDEVIALDAADSEIKTALASIVAASEDINATLQAVSDYTAGTESVRCLSFTPFSSETKRSGGTFENGKSYVFGAAEFVFSDKEKYKDVFKKLEGINSSARILVLGSSEKPFDGGLPDDITPMAILLIKDRLRDNVRETVGYFNEQGVTLKVISGDSVKTVANIASESGVLGADKAVDMTTIETDEQLDEAAEKYNIFGRVTPEQKKKLVLALKAHGHTVAMTGDGVNDVLALKEADCSVAMASGSEAARNVSQLVLVNNDFAAMPGVVAEGRRTINNIERSSALYLVKTIYSVVLTVFFIIFNRAYPFELIQLTLIGALTVGLPSFVLALQPNKNRIRGNFTFNMFMRAAPAAITVIFGVIMTALLSKPLGLSQGELSTVSVYLTALCCLWLILRLSIPINALRIAMLSVCTAGIVLGVSVLGWLFKLTLLGSSGIIMLIILAVVCTLMFNVLYQTAMKLIEKNNLKLEKR